MSNCQVLWRWKGLQLELRLLAFEDREKSYCKKGYSSPEVAAASEEPYNYCNNSCWKEEEENFGDNYDYDDANNHESQQKYDIHNETEA